MLQQIYPQVIHPYQFELNKDMNFSAAHYIPHQDAGICSNMHGHTYFCNITIAGNELDEAGFLVNFRDIKALISNRFDHTLLNEHDDFSSMPPSTEVTAQIIYNLVAEHLAALPHQPKCLQVFLRETPTSYVIYRGVQS